MTPAAETRGRTRGEAEARTAAFRVLEDVRSGAHADRSAAEHLQALDDRERSLARELAYGVLRLRGRLDAELARHVDRPLEELDPGVLDWLRLGLYQCRETRIPEHAAVNETVEGAGRTEGRHVTGLVNAVLRSALRAGEPDPPPLDGDPVARLTGWGSHPEWLVRRWLDRWPAGTVEALVEVDNRPPAVTGRLLDGDEDGVESARRALEGTGVEIRPLDEWSGGFRLVEGDPGELLRRVPRAVIQDPASFSVVDFVGSEPRPPVADLCAAPGTKCVGLAARREAGSLQVCGDSDRARLEAVGRAGGRAGADVRLVAADARRPALRPASVGTLLLDVPCTGTGTLRRRPGLRWRQGPDRLRSLVRLQEEILEGAAPLVESGGLLVYSTCSLEPEENEEQVERFLERHPEFRREEPEEGSDLPPGVVDDRGDLRVLPWSRGTDGSYAARLRRADRTG